jgi:ribosomal protein L11 methyltransferase
MTFGWRVLVSVPAADAELVADRLWTSGAIGIEEQGDDPVLLLAGFDDEAAARSAAAAEPGATLEVVDDDSWADEWRNYAVPVRVGPVLVQPAWLSPPADHDASVVITIDPGRAFGSGAHASTSLALEALWAEPIDGAHVLDVGTGSGVLAVAAALRGAARVIGTDIDPAALEACMDNARRNGVAARIRAVDVPPESFATDFDLVVANMLAVTLRELAQSMVEVVVPGGSIVLSGMLDEQAESVAEWFVEHGCVRRATLRRDGWTALVLDRGHPEQIDDELDEAWFADTPWAADAPGWTGDGWD